MDLKEIEALVEYYEDRIIINFEKYFSQLVLMDFYEGGYRERIKDEFYYDEYFHFHEIEITNLLLKIEGEPEDEYSDFQYRLIKLKRIIDGYLSDIKPNNYNDETVKRRNQFILNQTFDNKLFIEKLYNQLKINKLIGGELNTFKQHFTSEWEDKIQWLGTELQITNLITLLIENKYLISETKNFKYVLISTHFVNKKGNPFIEKQLSSVFSEKKENTFNDITNDILDEISTHF